jgi:hypothetical protein
MWETNDNQNTLERSLKENHKVYLLYLLVDSWVVFLKQNRQWLPWNTEPTGNILEKRISSFDTIDVLKMQLKTSQKTHLDADRIRLTFFLDKDVLLSKNNFYLK